MFSHGYEYFDELSKRADLSCKPEKQVKVEFQIELESISEISEENMDMTITAWVNGHYLTKNY